MARILKLTKREARVFSVNISAADPSKDIKLVMKYRRLSRKFASYCQPYWDASAAIDESIEEARNMHRPDSSEFIEVMRTLAKSRKDLDAGEGAELAADAHSEGILLETEEFTFLSGKFNELKGIPSEGEGGRIWEAIYEAFEASEEIKIKPV